jgi:hypothetical protein
MASGVEACDPDTYVEANGRPKWKNFMDDENHSLMKNETQDLVPRPEERMW